MEDCNPVLTPIEACMITHEEDLKNDQTLDKCVLYR